ncbi:MAG: hypothetical protein EOO80_21565 [Oxalobacteraceae bacterium]|nr:MAG: hypothetical protein EOO80_21565 [Oxalobacteraceae bacterium]
MPHRRLSRSLTLAAALTLGGGLAATLALTIAVARLEYDNQALAFGRDVGIRVAALRQGMDHAAEVVNVTNQLFATVQPVTREQFHNFTTPLLERNPFIVAFGFHRVVRDGERAAFEAGLQSVRPGTVLTELRVDGKSRALVPAPRRPVYNVVDYLEPMRGNEAAFGLNVGINHEIAGAIERAHRSGHATATGLLHLAQDPKSNPSFQVVMPVYDGTRRLVGDTTVVVRVQSLVDTALARTTTVVSPTRRRVPS